MENLRKTSRALAPVGLTILRVVTGFVLAAHGWMKLEDFGAWRDNVANLGIPAPDVMASLALAAELGGGIALMIGLVTPLAAAMIFVTMLVAIFTVHAKNGLMAQDGGFEYPLILAAVAIYFVARGAGPYSLDHLLFKRRRRVEPELKYGPYDRPITSA
jgi:putative oxidoreductase